MVDDDDTPRTWSCKTVEEERWQLQQTSGEEDRECPYEQPTRQVNGCKLLSDPGSDTNQ